MYWTTHNVVVHVESFAYGYLLRFNRLKAISSVELDTIRIVFIHRQGHRRTP